jgi:predicted kinase
MEALIFIGVQGSGKTTFYKERFFETHLRISLDMLRTRNRERLLLSACVRAGQRFVVDNTNFRASARAVYITLARQSGFRVIGYFFQTELRAALARNANRTDKQPIPVAGVAGTFKRLEPPFYREGFDELYSVTLGPDGTFAVDPKAADDTAP